MSKKDLKALAGQLRKDLIDFTRMGGEVSVSESGTVRFGDYERVKVQRTGPPVMWVDLKLPPGKPVQLGVVEIGAVVIHPFTRAVGLKIAHEQVYWPGFGRVESYHGGEEDQLDVYVAPKGACLKLTVR